MTPESRIYVAGHRGMVGSAIVRRLQADGFRNVLVAPRAEVDLTRADDVERFFASARPTHVVLAAARVGGILANDTYPADFIRDNLAIELNVIDAAHRHRVEKTLVLGSSCIYPRLAPQPITEDALLAGPLEPTNRAYAVAKIAGIVMAQSYVQQFGDRFISAMPTNLYGPGDNFDLASSHVLPALLRKFHEARVAGAPSVTVWGTGNARREFLHVDDLADACVFLMQRYDDPSIINVGTGEDLTIRELAETIARVVGYDGAIAFDTSKPDGTPRKLLDVSRMHALGWRASRTLEDGIRSTYSWYLEHVAPSASATAAAH